MKISFFISIFSSLQMTDAAVQHKVMCICLYFIHCKLFCGLIFYCYVIVFMWKLVELLVSKFTLQ
jgi:hypothetical protein